MRAKDEKRIICFGIRCNDQELDKNENYFQCNSLVYPKKGEQPVHCPVTLCEECGKKQTQGEGHKCIVCGSNWFNPVFIKREKNMKKVDFVKIQFVTKRNTDGISVMEGEPIYEGPTMWIVAAHRTAFIEEIKKSFVYGKENKPFDFIAVVSSCVRECETVPTLGEELALFDETLMALSLL